MKLNDQTPYPELLTEPIKYYKFVSKDEDTALSELTLETFKRLGLLFKYYDINPADDNSFMNLAICLALRHVPGMQVAWVYDSKPKGRKSEWDSTTIFALLEDIQEHIDKTGDGPSTACNKLVLKGKTYAGVKSGASLYVKYRKFKREGWGLSKEEIMTKCLEGISKVTSEQKGIPIQFMWEGGKIVTKKG